MEATYTPGDGLVVGAGSRWLLLGADPGAEAADRLWSLLTGPRAGTAAVLEAVAEVADPERGLVLVDLTHGAETSVVRGRGRHTTLDGVHTLALDDGSPEPTNDQSTEPATGEGRRLVGGVVAASAVRLRPAVRGPRPSPARAAPGLAAAGSAPAPTPGPTSGSTTTGPPAASADGLIDGVPATILAAVAPEPVATPVPVSVQTDDPPAESQRRMVERMGHTVRRSEGDPLPPAEEYLGPPGPPPPPSGPPPAPPADVEDHEVDHDVDHDGHTTYRPDDLGPRPVGPPDGPPDGPPAGGHLRQSTHETVLAVHCPAGHVTAAYQPRCRVCHAEVPPQEPHRMPRPRLGVLHLPDGERVPLDRGAVFGRQPSAVPDGAEWPHLVRLPPDATYVSRSHLSVELDGWLVLATDLGSRGGTTLRVVGRPPQRIRAHERYVWEPGQVLDLADSYEIVYEVDGGDQR